MNSYTVTVKQSIFKAYYYVSARSTEIAASKVCKYLSKKKIFGRVVAVVELDGVIIQ